MRAFRHPTGMMGRLAGVVMAHTNRRMVRRAIHLLDVQPDDKVLDVAFGPGVGIELLAASVPAGWVAGIDLSAEMVEQARARNTTTIEAGRVALQQGSVDHLPFDSATFDKALSIRSMQLWPDVVAGLREIRRVLLPGGRIALACTRRSGQTQASLTELLTAAGFAEPRVINAGGNLYALAKTPGRHGETTD